jgi:hypothetical protein
MNYINKIITIAITLFAVVSLCVSVPVSANFRIMPAEPESGSPKSDSWFVYSATPGEVIEDSVKIENESLDEILVQVSPHDLKVTNTGNFTVKSEGEENSEVGSWVTMNEATYVVPARGFIEIPFTLTVPNDIEDGEYAGGITAFQVDESLTTVEVLVRQGARIYVSVSDTFSVDSTVTAFSIIDITDTGYIESLPIRQSIGRDTVALQYNLEYLGNIFGELIGSIELEFEDGSKYTKRIREELIPRAGKFTKYVVTDQPYQSGVINARFVFEIQSLNVDSNQTDGGILEDSLTLSAEELGITQNAENPALNAPRTSAPIAQETINRIAYIIGGIVVTLIIIAGIVVYIVQKRMRQN